MKLYIARHGQTDWNVQHKAQGDSDIPLSEAGREQARKLSGNLKDIKFDAVYASPLKRAAETAQIATNGEYEIIYDDRLKERSFGDLEGKIIVGWKEATGVDIGDFRLNSNVCNIEPVRSVLARTKEVLNDVKSNHGENETILIVTHGQIARGLHHNLTGYDDNTSWWSVEFNNAESRRYEI